MSEKFNQEPPPPQYPKTFEEAERFESYVALFIKQNMDARKSGKPASEESASLMKKIKALIPLGTYMHFKGGEYEVYDVVEDVNTGMCSVLYASTYGPYAGMKGTRTLAGPDSFLRPIDREGYKGVRFSKKEDDEYVLID